MADTVAPKPVGDNALERRLNRLGLRNPGDQWADRYLLCEHIVDPTTARARQRFEAVARFSRDLIAHRWVKARETRERLKPKRTYYLSMEYLIGTSPNSPRVTSSAPSSRTSRPNR